jgi:BirA family biotin operon repressor/biotin-[acetyl-CoA-carboxylase] ligase
MSADLPPSLEAWNAFRLDELARHPWPRAVCYFPSIASTNDWALRHAAEPTLNADPTLGAEPTRYADSEAAGSDAGLGCQTGGKPVLVLAGEQTAGRGRGANRWWSAVGALTFSLIFELPDELSPMRRGELALVAGLAVRRTVSERCGGIVTVKWPNDVYVGERKIAGILIETAAARPPRFVLGIGLNVNNSLAVAPEEVRSRATALIDLNAGRPLDRTETLRAMLDALQNELSLWLTTAMPPGDDDWLARRWRPHCFLAGRTVRVESGGRATAGRCLGISNAGELLVQTENGGVVAVRSGVVASFDAV